MTVEEQVELWRGRGMMWRGRCVWLTDCVNCHQTNERQNQLWLVFTVMRSQKDNISITTVDTDPNKINQSRTLWLRKTYKLEDDKSQKSRRILKSKWINTFSIRMTWLPIKLWGIRFKTEPTLNSESELWAPLLQDFAKIRNKLAADHCSYYTQLLNMLEFPRRAAGAQETESHGALQVHRKPVWLRNFWGLGGELCTLQLFLQSAAGICS